MLPTQPRHDDIIIRRRFGEQASTHMVKQIYAVTYPGHTDQGAEHENYGEAEEVAEKIRTKVETLGGCESVVLNPLNWGMEQLELLAAEVLPRVAKR